MADDPQRQKRKLVPRSYSLYEDQAQWLEEEAWSRRLRSSAFLREVLDQYRATHQEEQEPEPVKEERPVIEPAIQNVVSVNEAAARKNVKPQTIRDAIARGVLKAYKSGKFYMVDAESLNLYHPIERGEYRTRSKAE
jgi:excisionase family DNA binding protein